MIVGVAAHEKNEHDPKTLKAALTSANSNRTKPIKEAICDRGYRGKKEVLGTKISLPGVPLKRDTKYQKAQKRKKFRCRAAIEPIIGHLKSDHRLSKNYLRGFMGVLMAASAWNLKKWMNKLIQLLIALRIALLIEALWRHRPTQRERYSNLYLHGSSSFMIT